MLFSSDALDGRPTAPRVCMCVFVRVRVYLSAGLDLIPKP